MPASGGFINIRVQFENQDALIARLGTFGQNIQTMRPAWEDVGQLLLRDFAEQFATEGEYMGPDIAPAWQPLTSSTVRERLAKGFGGAHPILKRTGDLMASVVSRGADGNIFEVSDNGITAGTSNPIAKYHQYGTGMRLFTGRMRVLKKRSDYETPRYRNVTNYPVYDRMPARKMIALRYATRPEIKRVISNYVREMARQAGLPITGG